MAKEKKLDANGNRKFGILDSISYAAGDFGCNMSFALKGTLTIFWSQFMGLGDSLYALLLIFVQIWDAINDPLIGSMIDADRRKYKRNKFLAYIWAGSIGLLVAGALCFIPIPNAPHIVKVIVFLAGYVIWDAFYTV
ncbi:MAG: MFS transporter, partial [Clostridia bacterium]|nr:MFS transporter [Clostridia bacterium]